MVGFYDGRSWTLEFQDQQFHSRLCVHLCLSDLDTGLTADKLKEMAATCSEKIYDTEDQGPMTTIKASLTVIQELAANLAQKMAECENELAISGQTQSQQQSTEKEPITPIVVRASAVRKESEETKILSRYMSVTVNIIY